MVLVASPFAFLGLIAVNARAAYQDWHPAEYGENVHQDWLAYAEPVRSARKLEALPQDVSPDDVKKVAKIWIDGYRDGSLKNISIVELDDVAYDGPRAELMESRNAVIYHVLHSAKSNASRGQFDAAAKQYLDAIELCQINKYSTPSAVAESSRLQALTIKRLAEILPSASESVWSSTHSRLSKVAPKQEQLRHIIARLHIMHNLAAQHVPAKQLNEGTETAFSTLISGETMSSANLVAMTRDASGGQEASDAFTNLITSREATSREALYRALVHEFLAAIEMRDQRESARKPLLLVSTKTFEGDKAAGNVSTVSEGLNSQVTLVPVSDGSSTGTR